ncbi:MAG: MOSC domain-containing protein [Sulfurimonas sp.]|jgi:MOSC domain-containing protein YiiM|nr:MOSC domain-containing protein [Sulfurimonadaceae bacterium]
MIKSCGKVLKLFVSKSGEKNRVNLKSIDLDEGGVIGDKFYAKDNLRSVLLSSKDSYSLAKDEGIDMEFGLLGENILMDFNPYNLKSGTKLLIGSATLSISQNCTICNHLSAVDKRLPKLLKNDRGIFAKVVKSGTINEGDNIQILPQTQDNLVDN